MADIEEIGQQRNPSSRADCNIVFPEAHVEKIFQVLPLQP